ncbi:thioredoxin [Paramecium bursaria Chlorella virus CVB-1]|nr:thioredoxin [Paramecium bursaria Chlorella virus CVB-1]
MMTITKVNTYQQMLKGISSSPRRHAIIKFSKKGCAPCKKVSEKFETMKNLDIDVYEVEFLENKAIARMFNVHALPTSVFFEDGLPMQRMVGLKEVDDFIDLVNDVVIDGCQVINWDE